MLRQRIRQLPIIVASKLSRVPKHDYIDADKTIQEAKSQGISVREYVEHLWNIEGNTDAIVKELKTAGALPLSEDVCEIGPGTGRYLERICPAVQAARYHIYETDKRWAKYLEQEYAPTVINHDANGTDLRDTGTDSCGVVCAFGVFVYLTLFESFNYFAEMSRVCKPDGYIIFDCFLAESWDLPTLRKRVECNETYPVVLPQQLIDDFFKGYSCERVHTFTAKYGCDISTYLIFKKRP